MSGSDGFRLGIDVGGTFTDFTLIDDGGGEGRHFKVPSTPADPAAAIGRGMLAMFADLALDPSNCRQLSHGTTVATNMVIERRGGRTGLLTTKGFRDILEIGRQDRPHLYDIHARKPPPLVPRHLRFEIAERIDADGAVLTPLDEAEVAAAARRLGEAGVEAVAIGFLHAYRFPEHERRARDIVAELLPGVPISTSSEVLPEYREYERFSTTAMNAYLSPRMGGYLDRFRRRVAEAGVPVPPSTSHSNGGLMSPAVAARYPVRACLSGPSAGVIGACRLAAAAGFQDLITFDVGGTSTDVSLIVDGRPGFTADRAVAGYPIRCPMVDVQVIGAGGGSIAWLDDAGALHVGPRSAAAEPGPAAYGRGGDGATITDANVVLHALNPVALLDGRMAISEDAARAALSRRVAEPLGLAVEAAAVGILRIAVANMARAIRAISTEQGHEVENFVLAAYGGAGPLHAARVA
ncbi:MAG: hydantoinase/oxoprolinase family protein, partial [Alphaproteobacteria bacterium]|nr:hydantoinase/oxoprolinase family protein [Alphaproteobacteria bacterium]